MNTPRSQSPLYTPLLVAFLGMLFAGWNAWDSSSVPCITAGCTIYQSFTFGGISLWWVGVAFFALIALLSALGHGSFGLALANMGLAFDCFLLCIMMLTLPCMACLMAAFLLALCCLSLRTATAPIPKPGMQPERAFSPLLWLWCLLLALNIGTLVRSEVGPWPIHSGSEASSIRIFFSPSCSACRQLVTGISEANAQKVTWYPVAEDEHDLAVIMDLNRRLAVSGAPIGQAFALSLEAPALSFFECLRPEALMTQFRLWRNQAHVIVSGEGSLPLVEFMGIPQALLREDSAASRRSSATPPPSSQQDATLPIDLGDAGSCGGSTTRNGQPCP